MIVKCKKCGSRNVLYKKNPPYFCIKHQRTRRGIIPDFRPLLDTIIPEEITHVPSRTFDDVRSIESDAQTRISSVYSLPPIRRVTRHTDNIAAADDV